MATTVTVAAWQGLLPGGPGSIAREEAYRNLAEQSTQAQSRTADWLDQAVMELAELRRRIAELSAGPALGSQAGKN